MIVHPTHGRRARLVAAYCAALAALTLAAFGSPVAQAGTAAAASGPGGPPIVATDDGAVRGVAGPGADAFLGLPYAAPPTDNLRWRPPAPPADWQGVRDATQFAPSCPQAVDPAEQHRGPARRSERGLPVPQRVHAGAAQP